MRKLMISSPSFRQILVLLLLATLAVTFPASQARAQTINSLYSFSGEPDGATPQGSLTLVGSTLYGTTVGGGASNDGGIFSIPVAGGAPTLLGSFSGAANGTGPFGSLTLSTDSSTLYGTTRYGGATNQGAIFSIPVAASPGTAPTLLGSFSGQANGFEPEGSLTLSGSTLYGTTANGGSTDHGASSGYGAVFSIPVTGAAPTLLGSFSSSSPAGEFPFGSLTLSGSTLYGMAYDGGAHGDGVIFSIPVGGLNPTSTAPTNLYSFSGTPAGGNPRGDFLTLIGSTLYGTTEYGGANNDGSIFSFSLTSDTLTILGSFNGTGDGANPYGDLTLVGSTFYGTTSAGGADGDGAIYSMPLTGGTPTLLDSFDGTNGKAPLGDLTLVGSSLFGTTSVGGTNNDGTVFSISTVSTVPEPSSIVLMVLGAIALGAVALRRRKATG